MSEVALYLATLIPVAHHCPSCTGILATSVKLVLATKWFSSFHWGRRSSITMVSGHCCVLW